MTCLHDFTSLFIFNLIMPTSKVLQETNMAWKVYNRNWHLLYTDICCKNCALKTKLILTKLSEYELSLSQPL